MEETQMEGHRVSYIEVGDIVSHKSIGKGEVIEKRYVPALKQQAYRIEIAGAYRKFAWLYESEIKSIQTVK